MQARPSKHECLLTLLKLLEPKGIHPEGPGLGAPGDYVRETVVAALLLVAVVHRGDVSEAAAVLRGPLALAVRRLLQLLGKLQGVWKGGERWREMSEWRSWLAVSLPEQLMQRMPHMQHMQHLQLVQLAYLV